MKLIIIKFEDDRLIYKLGAIVKGAVTISIESQPSRDGMAKCAYLSLSR